MSDQRDKLKYLSREADVFMEEQQRLLRALVDSVSREKSQLQQLHRLKDSLVATTLKLQVATKALENDEETIRQLRRDLFEAQKVSHEAVSKQAIAADLIQALRLEIIQLNRRMKDQMSFEDVTHSVPQSAIFQEADNQVERMMHKKGFQLESSLGIIDTANSKHEPLGANRPTDFQEWKMKKFLWAPDTPAGSENHDSGVVNELLHAAMHPQPGTGILRKNKSSIAKQRLHGDQFGDNKLKNAATKGNLPSVKSFSRKGAKRIDGAKTMDDDTFLKEFKNATVLSTKDRPKTSQLF